MLPLRVLACSSPASAESLRAKMMLMFFYSLTGHSRQGEHISLRMLATTDNSTPHPPTLNPARRTTPGTSPSGASVPPSAEKASRSDSPKYSASASETTPSPHFPSATFRRNRHPRARASARPSAGTGLSERSGARAQCGVGRGCSSGQSRA